MKDQILIIGAGISGLFAGKLLAEKKYQVTLIEARDRIGGRIFTDGGDFPFPVEKGAEFIHGEQPHTLALANECGAGVLEVNGAWCQFREGKLAEADIFNDQWDKMLTELGKLKTDTDIGSFLNSRFGSDEFARLRESVRNFVEGYDAADVHKASAFALRDEWKESEDATQYRIEGGYGKIVEFLAKEFTQNDGTILLSATAAKVRWIRNEVELLLTDGRILRGSRVIITAPIGILQRGDIVFEPALPFRENIFHEIGSGGVIKFQVAFSKNFWDTVIRKRHGDFAFILSDAEIPTWWLQAPDVPMLTGWWGGPSTFHVNHSRDILREKALRSLQYIFSCSADQLTSAIIAWKISDWVADPFSQCAYGYATVASEKARNELCKPIADTIYFAGEAFYSGAAMGTVEAALVSGREVSKRVSFRGK